MASNIEEIKRRLESIPRNANVAAARGAAAEAALRAVAELCAVVKALAQEVERIEQTLQRPEDQQ